MICIPICVHVYGCVQVLNAYVPSHGSLCRGRGRVGGRRTPGTGNPGHPGSRSGWGEARVSPAGSHALRPSSSCSSPSALVLITHSSLLFSLTSILIISLIHSYILNLFSRPPPLLLLSPPHSFFIFIRTFIHSFLLSHSFPPLSLPFI